VRAVAGTFAGHNGTEFLESMPVENLILEALSFDSVPQLRRKRHVSQRVFEAFEPKPLSDQGPRVSHPSVSFKVLSEHSTPKAFRPNFPV